MRHKKEKLLFVRVEFSRNVDRSADVVPQRHEAIQLAWNALPVVRKSIGIPSLMAFEPITASMKFGSSTLRHHLNLRSGVAAEFCALTVGGHLELRNRIRVDPVCKLLIDADVD